MAVTPAMQPTELDSISVRLMTATRALETAFRAWARGDASEVDVSDAFVRLGNEFVASRSRLVAARVPVADLIDVPGQLRLILEEALGLERSAAAVDQYDAQLRAVMTQLFHQLKQKQMQLPRAGQPHQVPPSPQQAGHHSQQHAVPAAQVSGTSMHRQTGSAGAAPQHAHTPSQQQYPQASGSQPRAQVNPPHSTHAPAPSSAGAAYARSREPSNRDSGQPPSIPAPKVPAKHDALEQLRRSGALERHASKRFSTHQLSRLINGTTAEQMTLPTTGVHKSGAPDFRDSNVVQARKVSGSQQRGSTQTQGSPQQSQQQEQQQQLQQSRRSQSSQQEASNQPQLHATPPPQAPPLPGQDKTPEMPAQSIHRKSSILSRNSRQSSRRGSLPSIGQTSSKEASSSPEEEKVPVEPQPFAVFLRIGSKVRKAMLMPPPSIAAIRLQFVEVLSFRPAADAPFPQIVTQDDKSGVTYEITEAVAHDVKEGTLLTLDVEPEEDKEMRSELKELRSAINELKEAVVRNPGHGPVHGHAGPHGPGAASNAQSQAGSPNMSSGRFVSPVVSGNRFKLEKPPPSVPPRELSADQVEQVMRDMAVLRQLSSRKIASMRTEITGLRREVTALANAAFVSDANAMAHIRSKLDDDSHLLLTRMEDLSDIIDAQRISVASRGVRYAPHELETVKRQLEAWGVEFENLAAYLEREKPVWTKTRQAELNQIVEEQEWLQNVNELFTDLRSDFEQSRQTFDLVMKANALPRPAVTRQPLPAAPPIKPGEEKVVANAVLNEIAALNLNSEQRAEAVLRAERLHKAKLAMRTEEFVDELSDFVGLAKLRQNGGFEEVERRRAERERQARELGEKSEAESRMRAEAARQERRAKKQLEQQQLQQANNNGNPAA